MIAAMLFVGSPLHVLANDAIDGGDGTNGGQAGEVQDTEANDGADGGEGDGGTEGGEQGDSQNTDDTEHGDAGDNMDDGVDGEDDPDAGVPPSGTTEVDTGDSTVVGDVDTNANVNVTNANITNGTTTATSTASTTPQEYPQGTHDTEVTNNNTGTSTLEADAEAQTGENVAGNPTGNVEVTTGDALAWLSFSNVLNFNALNSEGIMLFLDYLFGDADTDLRDLFSFFTSGNGGAGCTGACNDAHSSVGATNNNNSVIEYDVSATAGTGQNEGFAGNGDGYVGTGDATAGVTGTNVANVNFTDSQYLLLTLNTLGDLDQDIVFPGFEFFLNLFRGAGAVAGGSSVTATNNNNVSANTNITENADSGNNHVTAEGGSACASTGQANSMASVYNEFNQNIFGANHINILIQVHGDFDGEVFGLPEGLVWNETPQGIQIMTDPEYAAASAGGAQAIAGGADEVEVENNNDLLIDGNIAVTALTGDNKLDVVNGDGCVDTGDATTVAAVNNFGNINVIGSNWITAIFNIFGNFTGNISFGQPDLWIGGRAESLSGGFAPGSATRYHFTVTNFGDSPATDVTLEHLFDEALIDFSEDADETPGMRLTLGDLMPGDSVEVSFDAILADTLSHGQAVISTATVDGHETDANTADNTEELTLVASLGGGGGGTTLRKEDSKLLLEKKVVGTDEIRPGGTAHYEIFIENRGGPAYHSVLVDTIYNEEGEIVYTQHWELDTINPQEEITLEYDVVFASTTPSGVYRNDAYILAVENHPSLTQKIGKDLRSETVSAEVTILAREVADIVDELVEESPECSQYLEEYIKSGEENDPAEVMKLQHFLIAFEGADIAITGEYDADTRNAVNAFQEKYAGEVLNPWGIGGATGYVYYTTQKKINDLYCRGEKVFDLTPEQMREIEGFKARLEEIEAFGGIDALPEDERPDFDSIGAGEGDHFASLPAGQVGADGDYVDAPAREGVREARRIAPQARNAASLGELFEMGETTGEKVFNSIRSSLESVTNWVTQNFEKARTLSDNR